MHKKTTLQKFTVFLLKTILPVLVLSVAFQLATAQRLREQSQDARQKSQSATVVKPVDMTGLTREMVKANPELLARVKGDAPKSNATTGSIVAGTPTDVPEFNQRIAEKMALMKVPQSNFNANTNSSNVIGDVCTFNGGLVTGDLTLTNGRFFRDGIPSTCAAAKACGGPFGTGPYFYDTYTLQNLTCAAQCVTVNYIANAGGGDVFVVAYNGTFNPANLCTNYMADGGSSSLSGGAAVTFSFNVPANTTVTFVAMAAQPNTPCPSYTMTVTGLNCTPPPVCTPPTSSVLSQFQIPGPIVTLINEGFGTVVPAGWFAQNNSQPVGATGWFQGNAGVFPANSGPATSYAAANFNNTTGTNIISNWLFPPSVLMRNGDKFTFYTRTTSGAFPDRLQVRLNTTNTGTNVGATNTSVGDYSTLLLDINPTYTSTGYPTAWTQYTLTMSGLPAAGVNGRLAFRYFVENAGPGGANSDYIGIDDVVYTTAAFIDPTTCTGSTAGLKVIITGGSSATYNVTINATPGGPFTVNNYTSGDYIPVTPAGTTSYTLVSVIDATNPCCVGTGNSGNPTITVSPTTVGGITITEDPTGPLCAGDPKLLTVTGAAGAQTFTNPALITINSNAITTNNLVVSGLPTSGVTVTNVKINGFSHTWAGDVNMVLQNPAGTQNVILMANSNADPLINVSNLNFTFTDAAAASLPAASPWVSGTYKPTNRNGSPFAFYAPGPTVTGPSFPASPTLATFTGNPNGTWKLFVEDKVGGDQGSIAGGFSVTFNYPPTPFPPGTTILWTPTAGLSSPTSNPVAASPMTTRQYTAIATVPGGCQTSASILITVNQLPAVTSNPANVTACAGTNASFTVGATGAGITYQWQVSTNGGGAYANISNGTLYGGVTTATLSITGVTNAMNSWRYRCVISGTCPPAANSTGAILTVTPLPVIAINQASPICGGVAGINGTLLSVGSTPPPVPGSVIVNSGAINLAVPDNTANGVNNVINVAGVPANATITNVSVTLNMSHTYPGDMIFNLKAPNGNILNLYKYGTGLFTGPASGVPTWGWYGATVSQTGTTAWSSVNAAPFIYNNSTAWKADAINTPVAGPTVQNPTGFVSTEANFTTLYSNGPSTNGAWTLAMCDGGPGDLGTLASWTVKIDYTVPGGGGGPTVTYTWAPLAGLYTNATATTPYAGGNTNTVYAAPAVNTVYTVTGNETSTGCSNTASITVIYTPAAPTINPASVAKCRPDAPVQLCVISSLAPQPFTTTYTSGAINVPIPEGNFPNLPATAGVSTIAAPLPATALISNIRVSMNIAHAYVGDVVAVLKAPNGQIINLDAMLNKTNNPGANFVNTVISSTGTTLLSAGTAPFTATFKADLVGATFTAFGFTLAGGPVGFAPTQTNWSSLYSIPNGNWTLAMYDVGAPDVGNLTSWSITFDYLYGPPAQGIWSPIAGLYSDAAGTIPYVAGTPATCVYANPLPASDIPYTYNVTVASVGPDAFQTFTNTAPITITNGGSTPYPSNITVSGLPTTGAVVENVILTGLSHTWSDDIDILLQSPTGQNVILMSDVGGASTISNATYTFSDAGSAMGTAANPTGTYAPTNLVGTLGVEPDNFPAPGPGSVAQPTPALSMFTGNPNGVWKLFAVDDFAGDDGVLAGGYSIRFKYATPGCTSAPKAVTVKVNEPVVITSQPVDRTVCTDKVATFSVVVTGSATIGYRWEVSTNNGNPPWNTVNNGGVYSGATTATLTITAPPVSMSGYVYRCVVQGATPCPAVTTFQRTLTVNPLPVIVISSDAKLFPGLTKTITSTVSPAAAATYSWMRDGIVLSASSSGVVSGIGTANLTVDIDGLGEYVLMVTDVNNCTNVSNKVFITDSASSKCFLYPNPTDGKFEVRYFSVASNSNLPRTLSVYTTSGVRVLSQNYSIGRPYDRMPVDMRNQGKGVYFVEVQDVNGNRLALCKVVIQ
ncbi:MAG: T9SS type A sorting domain-containing protein [Chitinophagaceae bacterium]|nr:T9SS type A sorting domain-containing protein [Chitinophagaceae bacterium]